MNYKQYTKLNEALKNFSYQIPTDKEELLFDFYMSTFLTETGNDNIDYSLKDMKERLYPYLKKELLEVVLFSITAELRHFFNENSPTDLYAVEAQNFLSKYQSELYIARGLGDRVIDKNIEKTFRNSSKERKNSYVAAKKAANNNKILIVESALHAFEVAYWQEGYGGMVWYDICDGWLELNETKTLNEMVIWIDHIYDLEHNNNTVLDKVESYSKYGGHSWIGKALDLKRDIKSPYEIFDYISLSMKKIAGFTIKENEGTTFEQWKKESTWTKDIWKGGTWEDGTWESGVWKGGTWEGGTWESGVWKDGTWKDGTWEEGTWERGWWQDGIWKRGIWEDGRWQSGVWEGGVWEGGVWKDGWWNNGTWKDGIWERGWWENGEWQNGAWKNGTWENGEWQNGAWKNGTWLDGAWEDGTWENGTWKNGTWDDGWWSKGTWEKGIWKGGWIRDINKKGNYKDDWEWDGNYVRSSINPKEYFKK